MAADLNARVRLSSTEVAAGEIVEVRTLVNHPMESGQRRDAEGALIPRDTLTGFRATFEGELVFECVFEPAISANPYLAFTLAPPRSGTLVLTWIDDDGSETTASEALVVR
jgi:thiosulfate oxidation carrier complex protein SoxZ